MQFRAPAELDPLSGLLLDPGDHGLNAEQQQELATSKDRLGFAGAGKRPFGQLKWNGKIEAKPIDFDVSDLFAALRGILRPSLLNQMVNLIFEDIREIPPCFR